MPDPTDPIQADPDVVAPDAEPGGAPDEPTPKLVPVSESIRYRRRAQAAEQQLEALNAKLAEASTELERAREQMAHVDRLRQIDQQLIAADAVDLEAARLLTEHAIEQMDDAQISEVVDDLRRHKPYLFRRRESLGGPSPRPRGTDGALDEAAAHAAASGDRRDLLRYLRLRRRDQ